MKAENIKGLIFDYGGTLDSEGRHWSFVLREGLAHAGITATDEAWREAYVFAERALAKERIIMPQDTFHDVMLKKINIEIRSLANSRAINLEACSIDEKAETAARYCYQYARNCVEQSREVLLKLKALYPMVLVTNFYGNIHAVLNDFKLDFFDDIIESSVVGVRKPDPKIYQFGVQSLNLSAKNVMVVGDSYSKDIVPAASIGCKTVWLKGESWSEDHLLPNVKPDAVIESITQLPSVLTE